MQTAPHQSHYHPTARSIGRIASVTGAKAIVLLDTPPEGDPRSKSDRPEMGMLLAIDTVHAIVLATVSALSVPVPAQGTENEIRIAELGLVGELKKSADGGAPLAFHRGTATYPALGDRVRLATKHELQLTYSGSGEGTVRIGCIRQDPGIAAVVRVDELLGKHFAVLGTTGTGKSCSTALIFRAILEKNPNAHIVLLDPHNEYSTAFGGRAEVVSPRNMQLPLWLLNFEEAVEVLVGDGDHKAEVEILQELIPLAKSRYSTGRAGEQQKFRRPVDTQRFTVDTPVPYRISDLTNLIDERTGKLENRKDLAPYRQLKTRIETFSQDGRYAFMFGSVTVYDGMAQVLSRLFRIPVNGKPITIVELTGLPPEVVNVVVSVLCRLAFDFALWGEGKVPITVVCEEAHRYVPLNPQMGFEPCKRAIAKIAKEGRKYGASLCIVTQRPAEIDPTILSQCNTVFALRMSNDRDQAIVSSAISDTGTGLLEFLPALGHREAIAFGDGVPLPVRLKFDELPDEALPRSSTAQFSEKWQSSIEDEGFLDSVVERWRAAGVCGGLDAVAQAHLLADAVSLPSGPGLFRRASDQVLLERYVTERLQADEPDVAGVDEPVHATAAAPPHAPSPPSSAVAPPIAEVAGRVRLDEPAQPMASQDGDTRQPYQSPLHAALRRSDVPAREAPQAAPASSNSAGAVARSALRERLLKPLGSR